MSTAKAHRVALACLLLVSLHCAHALDPTRDVSQYGHTTWKIRDGFAKAPIIALAQTTDGYLWLGTESGLLRFDGVRTVAWQPPAGMSLPDNTIRILLGARDGTLWIGTERGLASWKDHQFISYPAFDGNIVNGLVEDREGTVWVGMRSPTHGLLCALRGGNSACHGEDGSLGTSISSLYVDSKGRLWGAGADRMWLWNAGSPIAYTLPGELISLQSLGETASGDIVAATNKGVWQVVSGAMQPFPIPAELQQHGPRSVLRDRDGALWIGTVSGGLLHVHEGRTDVYGRIDGLSASAAAKLFEDREGNIWVTTSQGLDRFGALTAARYSVEQGFPGRTFSVLASNDGGIWLSGDMGLYAWRHGQMTLFQVPQPAGGSLFQDGRGRIWLGARSGLGYIERERFVPMRGVPPGYIDSITEDGDGNLWIGHREAGVLRLSPDRKTDQIPWTSIGQSGIPSRLAADPVRGGLWLGFGSGDIVHLVEGRIRESHSVPGGPGNKPVNELRVAPDGTVWVASKGGLIRIKDGRSAILDSKSGLPCDSVFSMMRDDDGSTWLYLACGLVRLQDADFQAWIAAADTGNPRRTVRTTVLDLSDGIDSVAILGTSRPIAAKAPDGTLWLKTLNGATMVDPHRLAFNGVSPLVHVEEVIVDRTIYQPSAKLSLPPLVRDVQIDYTALSFVTPEKVRFRYKLEGRDRDWQDAGNRRQAFYADLDPGTYRFRVVACNNSGVWNEEGASLDFSVAPAYWQTQWFRALCVFAFMTLLWALYQLRVRQLARQFNRALDARVGERTRIARDLHDTLLQSFHGLLLRFQTAMDLLPARPAEAKQVLGSAIDQAAEAITEGRDAVQGLRSSTQETNDLADAIRALGEQLAADESAGEGVILRVESQGGPRALHPIVRDEIVRIAGEALRNAFRHADAKQVEVELHYDDRNLRLRVRDDGKGIDPKVLKEGGREGHFGLRGMRERAKLIGGKLAVWSGPDDGTEVELAIPASHAYAAPSSTWLDRLGQRFQGQRPSVDS